MKVLPKVSGEGDWWCEFEYIGSDVSKTSDFSAYKSVLKMAQREFKLECD
jgi:hypothetical protein